MTMAGFESVRATVATHLNDPGGDSRSRRSQTTKRSHDYIESAGTDDEMGSCSQAEGNDAENEPREDNALASIEKCENEANLLLETERVLFNARRSENRFGENEANLLLETE
jgi:hypothetical protein